MPAADQSVRRQVGRRWSKISTPDSMALTISNFPALNAFWSVSLHSNFTLGLRKGLKGSSVFGVGRSLRLDLRDRTTT